MFKGKKLKKGDTIALIAPSSPAPIERVNRAVEGLEQYGFEVVVGESCYANHGGYLSGDRYLRAGDIHEMFSNPYIDGIFCLRGGYGSSQLLPILDYDLIRQHPKVFVGFSDITALHQAFLQRSNLVTFHGPSMAKGLHYLSDCTRDYFFKSIMSDEAVGEVVHEDKEWEIQSLTRGKAEGQLVGGNLTLITALLGTPFELDTKDKILFIEDVNEAPYRVDRMLTQLLQAGKLTEAAGIVLGTWDRCQVDAKNHFTIEDLFHEIIAPLDKPTLYNLAAGHGPENITLPLGVQVKLDADEASLVIHEAAVRGDF